MNINDNKIDFYSYSPLITKFRTQNGPFDVQTVPPPPISYHNPLKMIKLHSVDPPTPSPPKSCILYKMYSVTYLHT